MTCQRQKDQRGRQKRKSNWEVFKRDKKERTGRRGVGGVLGVRKKMMMKQNSRWHEWEDEGREGELMEETMTEMTVRGQRKREEEGIKHKIGVSWKELSDLFREEDGYRETKNGGRVWDRGERDCKKSVESKTAAHEFLKKRWLLQADIHTPVLDTGRKGGGKVEV